MIRIRRSINYKLQDDAKITGLFFIIDGELYVKQGEDVTEMHVDFFKELIRNHPELSEYKQYPYLYFPRGAVFRDTDSGKVMFNYPPELSDQQIAKLRKRFMIENDNVELSDSWHYSFDQIKASIKNNKWDKEIEQEELDFAENFFYNQINKY